MLKTALAAALLLTAAPAFAATVQLVGSNGQPAGTATLTEAPTGVLIHVEAMGLKPGWHGMHLHEKADCMGPAFTSAGGHMNHADPKAPHGLLNPGGPDFGDLPNIFAGADGKVMADAFTTQVSLSGKAGKANLMDADGSSLMIHENADDYTTQPIGGAGARVACGAIK
jgi:Cu-Zn family superoxide dismutase